MQENQPMKEREMNEEDIALMDSLFCLFQSKINFMELLRQSKPHMTFEEWLEELAQVTALQARMTVERAGESSVGRMRGPGLMTGIPLT